MGKIKNPPGQIKWEKWTTLKKQLLKQVYTGDLERSPKEIEWDRKTHEDYLKWLEGFFKKDVTYGGTGKESAKKLPDLLLEINQISPRLLNDILQACYSAYRFKPTSDPGLVRRKRVQEFKQDIPLTNPQWLSHPFS